MSWNDFNLSSALERDLLQRALPLLPTMSDGSSRAIIDLATDSADIAMSVSDTLGPTPAGCIELLSIRPLLVGAAWKVTITVLPLIGLIFSSTVRRARRTQAGESAPPADPNAEAAERTARLIVWAIVGLVAAGIFTGAVLAVGIGIGSS